MCAARRAAPRRRRPAGPDRQRRRGDDASRRCSAPTSRSPPPTSWPGHIPARSRWPRSSAHLLRDSALQTSHHASTPQGPGPVLAALRPAGPRRGSRRARLPPAGPRRRAERRDGQPARLPRGRRGGRGRRWPPAAASSSRGGNFHGEPIALALDFAKLAVAELGSISERRTALLRRPAPQRRPARLPRRRRRARTPG